eukprot:jgi/Chrzof1/11913/Cz06g14130.t1
MWDSTALCAYLTSRQIGAACVRYSHVLVSESVDWVREVYGCLAPVPVVRGLTGLRCEVSLRFTCGIYSIALNPDCKLYSPTGPTSMLDTCKTCLG